MIFILAVEFAEILYLYVIYSPSLHGLLASRNGMPNGPNDFPCLPHVLMQLPHRLIFISHIISLLTFLEVPTLHKNARNFGMQFSIRYSAFAMLNVLPTLCFISFHVSHTRNLYQIINTIMAIPITYDHRLERIGHPVRSAIHKLKIGGLVVGWVTTSEYPLLYVPVYYLFFVDLICLPKCFQPGQQACLLMPLR